MHPLAIVVALFVAQAYPARSGYAPEVEADDGEAAKALAGIVVPKGFRVELFAAEPHCANLVALDVDPNGRCYVVETFRRDKQVLDMRDWPEWLEDDLACRTVADRVAMIRQRAGAKLDDFRKESDRVRLLRDRDGDGRVETSTVFADGFADYADGIAAGVLARRGDVYFADMPNLWRLRDRDGDGVAEQREVLSTGYGVHFNFVGHDLHGLRIGPDGRLWFSLGDRGLDVVTKEGRHLQLPDSGAVLRCELDGSNLELVHTGLRNPQELAFNDAGDLFTCDNNSDSGDQARLVHVVEGGNSGWSVGWQWIEGPTPRGPWNSEKMWHPRNADTQALQPAFIVPCVTNLVSGPSGLAHEPGTAFPSRYRDHFFICDFEAEVGNTRVVAFSVKPAGATYVLASEENFVSRGIVATDCDFAADGCMYVTDWVHGWAQPKRGRVWRIFDPAARAQPIVKETRDLLRQEIGKYGSSALMQWLGHPDQRVRLEAQLGLAARGEVTSLRTMARLASQPLARLHAIWGLGQVARAKSGASAAAIDALRPLLRDGVAEVRAQAAKVLGESGLRSVSSPGKSDAAAPIVDGLIALLADREPRPRSFAALALGHLGDPRAVDALITLAEKNSDQDAYLRHSLVMGLAGCARPEQLVALVGHGSPAVRMAVLLAMRRRAMPELARFLDDRERPLVVEAARAIHDLPIESGLPALALAIQRNEAADVADGSVLPLLARSINANFRLGGETQAQRLAFIAAGRVDLPEAVRADALRALTDFDAPPARDRVLGIWRPCAPGRSPAAVNALGPQLRSLLTEASDPLRELTIRFVERMRVAGFERELRQLVLDETRASGVRVAALNALAALSPKEGDAELRRLVEASLASGDPKLRGAARNVLAQLDPAVALEILSQALEGGTTVEQQDAFATLGAMDYPPAAALLGTRLDQLLSGRVAPAVTLDLLEAAKKKGDAAVVERIARFEAARAPDDPLAAWRECELGGDPERGRRLFLERNEFQCMKCHRVGGEGASEVGPDVAGAARRGSREYFLESIVLPNRKITVGFTNTVFVLDDGDLVDGRVIGETPTHWLAVTTDRGTVQIRKSAVTSMRQGLSAMPNDLVQRIGKRELRDLVAWLATLE